MKHDKYLKKQKAIEKLEVKSNLSKDKKNLKKKKEKEEESTDPLAEKDATAAADGGDEDDDVVIDGGIELNIDDLSNKEEVNVQDSGYTRPRVLILCPFRSTALEIVTSMKDIFNVSNGATGQGSHEVERTTIKNWEKFQNEYSLGDEEAPPDNQHKPSDWQSIFKDNLDDEFKMGIQVNPLSGKGNGKAKGVHMRLFTDFYHSDIILASPLGLRLILENSASSSSSSSSVNETKRGVESDYLSSLEIIYFHQADILLMQNWSHVEYILQHCNQLPQNKSSSSSSLSIDFTRIRPYFLDNLSKQHRQIIISSNFHDPIFNSLMRQECQSKAGIIKLKKNPFNGCLSSILTQVKQIFNIIPTTSFLNEEQERFQYFTSNVLTPLLRLKQSHTLIVTPSYLHFVQVRNELIRREVL
jgi:U3 small nucleolar RNA-associated protein 25